MCTAAQREADRQVKQAEREEDARVKAALAVPLPEQARTVQDVREVAATQKQRRSSVTQLGHLERPCPAELPRVSHSCVAADFTLHSALPSDEESATVCRWRI